MNQSNSTLQLISALIVLVPVAIIFIKQKGNNKYFLSLAAANVMFFISTFLLNKFVALPATASNLISTCANVLQAPLTLMFLLYFTENKQIVKAIRYSLVAVLGISVAAMAVSTINTELTLNLMTLGVAPVFIIGSVLFIQHVKTSVYENKGSNNAFMLSSIVFAYGSYMLLLTLHFIAPEKHATDLRSLFGLITIISTAFTTISIVLMDMKAAAEEAHVVEDKKQNVAFAQWENFNLASTPEIAKNSVTNISKYYPGYNKN